MLKVNLNLSLWQREIERDCPHLACSINTFKDVVKQYEYCDVNQQDGDYGAPVENEQIVHRITETDD